MEARPDKELPPSVVAARRTARTDRARSGGRERAYAAMDVDDDLDALAARLAATRALLTATTPEQVVAVVATLVHDLGGGLVPARLTGGGATLPLDVSLGLSEPMLPWAEPVSVGAMRLARMLPEFVEDARAVVTRLQSELRLAEEGERDALTDLFTRRAWRRRLGAAAEGDAVCLVELDRVKAANDTAGHAAGDEVLRAVGALLRGALRSADACGRYGGEELACLAVGMPPEALARRMDDVRSLWHQQRPAAGAGVGLSVGVAAVGPDGPRAALAAADRALHRAKAGGRDATAVAGPDDGGGSRP